ncbi:PaaI family thioesterase [Persicobacter sp. CCB-QB2]|uniref:PaaI family thioesterase n=1 Tax=Persicobacter sp. CCB-QB2 TaxID=1561025 RepID=UPI0006A9B71E|nr:DUF4442 domain-containing protein [Persicobacter sp. CCB-QB2]
MQNLANAMLKEFGKTEVPMIGFCEPEILKISAEEIAVKIPLNDRTKNHLQSMYIGTLTVGADIAGGLLAFSMIKQMDLPIDLVFKDFKADFLKRPEADVTFRCTEGAKIQKMVQSTMSDGERVTEPIAITAYCPDKFGEEAVATFILTLSLKKRT